MNLFSASISRAKKLPAKLLPGLLNTGVVVGPVAAISDAVVNCFVIQAPDGLICIDTGWRADIVAAGFLKLKLSPDLVQAVFLTHQHWDHAGCVELFPAAKLYAGAPFASLSVSQKYNVNQIGEEQPVTVAGLIVNAVESPGHTPDSVSYLVDESYLFTGDALRLKRGIAHPLAACLNQDKVQARCSIQKLARLNTVRYLFTAHSGMTANAQEAFQPWRAGRQAI